jgi:putative endonuclease
MKCFVYILFSESHNRFYIGQTNNFSVRLEKHNNGYEKSTAPFAPWKQILIIEKNSRSEAMMLEKKLKNLNSDDLRKFIQKYS